MPNRSCLTSMTLLLLAGTASAQWGETACTAGSLPDEPVVTYNVSGTGFSPEAPTPSCTSAIYGDKWLRFSPPYPRRMRVTLSSFVSMRYTGSCSSLTVQQCAAGFPGVMDEVVFVSPGTTQFFRMGGVAPPFNSWSGTATFNFPGGSECQQQPDDLGRNGFPTTASVAPRLVDFGFNSSGPPAECPPYTGDLLNRSIFRDVIFGADFPSDGVLQLEISEPQAPTATFSPRFAVYTDDANPTELHYEVLPQFASSDMDFVSGPILVGPQTGSTERLIRLGATVSGEPEISADAEFRFLANNAVCENAEMLVSGVPTTAAYNNGLRVDNPFEAEPIRRLWYEVESIGVQLVIIVRSASDPFLSGGLTPNAPCPPALPSSDLVSVGTTIFFRNVVPPAGERQRIYISGAEGPGNPSATVVLRHMPPGGDADGDGALDRDDVEIFCEALDTGSTPVGASFANMDLDMDGDIDSLDLLAFCVAYDDPDPNFHCLCPLNCPGNIDQLGTVSLSDFTVLAANFGLASGATRCDGDLTGDDAVSLADFSVLAANFGLECDGTTLRTPCFGSFGAKSAAAPDGPAFIEVKTPAR
jgi:hypothetical protein